VGAAGVVDGAPNAQEAGEQFLREYCQKNALALDNVDVSVTTNGDQVLYFDVDPISTNATVLLLVTPVE